MLLVEGIRRMALRVPALAAERRPRPRQVVEMGAGGVGSEGSAGGGGGGRRRSGAMDGDTAEGLAQKEGVMGSAVVRLVYLSCLVV